MRSREGMMPLVVSEIVRETPSIVSVRLEAPDGTPLPPWAPGSHVDVQLITRHERQYSLCGDPADRRRYRIAVHREELSRGGSHYIHTFLRPGHRVWVRPPRNMFALAEAPRHLLIAAGIGITPLLSMAEALEARGEPFVLHYYASRRDEIAFATRLQRGFAHGRVLVHLSDAGESPREHVPIELRAATSRDQLYLCGPTPFMDRFGALAGEFGWSDGQIHREHFGALDSGRADDGTFEVQIASTGQRITVPAGRTIASALVAAGIEVGLSCEQGMCGACLTGVLDGEPDHRDSVLNDAERAANSRIAVCCSRSRSARLTLDL